MKKQFVRFLKWVFLLGGIGLLSSCASVSELSQSDNDIDEEQAVILLRLNSPKAGSITLSPSTWDAPVAGSTQINVARGDNLLALKLKKRQRYYITRFHENGSSVFSWFKKTPFYIFSSDTGLTYAGDVRIEARQNVDGPLVQSRERLSNIGLSIYDNEQMSLIHFKEKYPELFSKYSYKKQLIQPGYGEVLF